MSKPGMHIRKATRDELDSIIDWAAREGWNPGLNDADCYFQADPDGFLLGTVGGRPIASISAVRYGDDYGFIGFYIVEPEWRGKGFGLQIWNAAIEQLAGRTVALDGVVDQQSNYAKSGFEYAFRNVRYEGRGDGHANCNQSIIAVKDLPYEHVLAYTSQFFPAARREFDHAWLFQPSAWAVCQLAGDAIVGCGVLRKCRNGFKIGPLLADTEGAAESIYSALKGHVPAGIPFFLDTPEVNEAAITLASRHGMKLSFETARMYLGKAPVLPIERTYGITSFEVG
ncbi:MAG: N-acetyltransferase GCN5 [Lysobacteraceae bacterium]|nr:MAG: N-acetyltransferase GCN5 [Xanthomonadaceae bacterium]